MPISLSTPATLDAGARAEVHALVDAIAGTDGTPPLSEQALLSLSSDQAQHVLARDGGALLGYGQRAGDAAEVAARADAAEQVLAALEADAPGPLVVWVHGRHSALGDALDGRGYRRERTLHQLRRPLVGQLPDAPVPDGVTIRTFVVGSDEQDWLAVNAAAFATHPEQGRWTIADLAAREGESWFDPDGFLLAHRGTQLVGFHWTKIHPDGAGEVYVIGVDPAVQGMRLGPALLLRGLEYLRGRGCPDVLLYVDDTNTAAMRLYERFGFASADVDVQWRAPLAS
jgi:mycothiol synthase